MCRGGGSGRDSPLPERGGGVPWGGAGGIIQWREWRCEEGGWDSPLPGRGGGMDGRAHPLAGWSRRVALTMPMVGARV